MPPRSAHFRMADRLADGNLAEVLGALSEQGLSPESIAARLYRDYGIEAAGMTVRRWLVDLDDEVTA